MRVPDAKGLLFRLNLVLGRVHSFALPSGTLLGQASYQAQIRGVVSDATGAVMPNATITITEVGTNVRRPRRPISSGEYILQGVRPSTYVVKAQASGFRTVEQKGVVLAVGQETSLNFTLHPAGTSTRSRSRRPRPCWTPKVQSWAATSPTDM